jgi:virginiamycin B lyase
VAWSSTRKGSFFVEFGSNKIASIDPDTMAIKEYVCRVPTRPRRVAITSDDVPGIRIIRAAISDASIEDWQGHRVATRGPKPHGIAAYNDIIWYSESAVRPNTLVRFDPKTEKFQTWTIASGGGVVRNMMPTREGNLVLAESGVNKVALVEVAK